MDIIETLPTLRSRFVYLMPRLMSAEPVEVDVPVGTRDPLVPGIPALCDGFRFEDYYVSRRFDGVEMQHIESKPINVSPTFYPGGTLYTLAQIEERVSRGEKLEILRDNMRANGWPNAMKTVRGRWTHMTNDVRTYDLEYLNNKEVKIADAIQNAFGSCCSFTYTNWRGETQRRRATFDTSKSVRWGVTEHHKVATWLVDGTCIDKNEKRTFNLSTISDLVVEQS